MAELLSIYSTHNAAHHALELLLDRALTELVPNGRDTSTEAAPGSGGPTARSCRRIANREEVAGFSGGRDMVCPSAGIAFSTDADRCQRPPRSAVLPRPREGTGAAR